jgi:predicted small lipoprotein YifL
MPNQILTSLLLIALATLAGCGQMGPLYMPPPETPAAQEASPAQEVMPAQQEPPAEEPAAPAVDGSQES